MASFTLQPCKIRSDRFVPTEDEAITLEWVDVKKKLAPSGSQQALVSLRRGRVGFYVGLAKHPKTGRPSTFLLGNIDGSPNISWRLKQDTSFAERLIEVYRIEAVTWDDQCIEYDGEKHD